MEPLTGEQLEPVLRVIEAAQSLAAGDDVPEMLASLSRQLTEFLGASACDTTPTYSSGTSTTPSSIGSWRLPSMSRVMTSGRLTSIS